MTASQLLYPSSVLVLCLVSTRARNANDIYTENAVQRGYNARYGLDEYNDYDLYSKSDGYYDDEIDQNDYDQYDENFYGDYDENYNDQYSDYYLDDDYNDYYNDYYGDYYGDYYYGDNYYDDYYSEEAMRFNDILMNIDADILDLVDEEFWDDDDYWEGFYTGLMDDSEYEMDHRMMGESMYQAMKRKMSEWKKWLANLPPIKQIHQWIFDFAASKVEKSLIDPFLSGSATMIKEKKDQHVDVMKTSVQNTLGSWMPQSVTDRLIQVLSRKADEICGFITDQWHTQMAKAYNAQKKKLAEQRELKFYEYKYVAVAPPQIGAEKTNRNLFHKMVHWFDQKFWNGGLWWILE